MLPCTCSYLGIKVSTLDWPVEFVEGIQGVLINVNVRISVQSLIDEVRRARLCICLPCLMQEETYSVVILGIPQ